MVTKDGEVITLETPYQTKAVAGPFWKTPWNHDRDAESASVRLECKDPSKTQQQFAKEADINVILAKFLKTGELNLSGAPTYVDIPDDSSDLQESIVTQYQVDQAWNELPAAARHAFKDPRVFLEYVDHCMKTGDLDPLRELGLAKPEASEQAIGVPPVPQSPLEADKASKAPV